MQNIIQSNPEVELVICHSDNMAVGAAKALEGHFFCSFLFAFADSMRDFLETKKQVFATCSLYKSEKIINPSSAVCISIPTSSA